MKNLKIILVVFWAIISLAIVSSCNKEKDDQYLNVAAMDNIGKLHNDFLTTANNTFPNGLDYTSKNYLNTLNDFNYQHIIKEETQQKYGINPTESYKYQSALDANKKYLLKNELVYDLKANPNRLQLQLPELIKKGEITTFGGNLLLKFLNDIELNYEGKLSNIQLQQNVLALIKIYDNNHYSVGSGEGKLIGGILSISKNSLEWWLNPTNFRTDQIEPRLAPWIAADLLGAVCGAGSSILSDVLDGNDVDWSDAFAWGLGGAVCGSVGIRIGRK